MIKCIGVWCMCMVYGVQLHKLTSKHNSVAKQKENIFQKIFAKRQEVERRGTPYLMSPFCTTIPRLPKTSKINEKCKYLNQGYCKERNNCIKLQTSAECNGTCTEIKVCPMRHRKV